MKILLFGSNGQVGWELRRSLAPLGSVIALDARSVDSCGDLTDLDGVARTVRSVAPDIIVNAAAYTAVDQAESEPELAHTINTLAPQAMALEARASGAWMVHYSTDYVFDGHGDQAWSEADATGPISVYGSTKLLGEQAIRASGCQHLIFRCSWIYAARGSNFTKTMLRLAQERESMSVVDDQFGAPTGAELVADVTAHAIRHVRTNPADAGLYHVAARGETSWHGYARHVLAQAAKTPMAAKIKVKEVMPVPATAFSAAAHRPHNSRLNTAKLQATFDLVLPAWELGVDRVLAEILALQFPVDS